MIVNNLGKSFTRHSELIKYTEADRTTKKSALEKARDISRFEAFWELMDVVRVHGYTRAAMSVVGRSAIGAWWTLVRNPDFKSDATESKRKKLMRFYMGYNRTWDNIKDYYTIATKLMIAAMYLKYFGQAAFEIVRNEYGRPIGYDFLPGLVVPNVDSNGYFKEDEPAFCQYPTRNMMDKAEFDNPNDIVFIVNPDWEGRPSGGSDMESLSAYTLPLDLYLQAAARNYMKNRDRPEVVYQLAPDISDDGFDAFVETIRKKYAGAENIGKSPVAVRGDLKVIELSKLPNDLPYQEAREDTRTETFAVTGVTGAKLGVTQDIVGSNVRELRREFFETSMLPLFKLIEQAFYLQIHVREFNTRGWEFQFNEPDFLTKVEQATVHMRYIQSGVFSPNIVLEELGKEPREGGDVYVDPSAKYSPSDEDDDNPQGSPPEGREDEPDAPSEVGEPTLDDQDPPRGDNHDEEAMLDAFRQWRSFAVGRAKKGRNIRLFYSEHIPDDIASAVQKSIEECEGNVNEIRALFDEILSYGEEV